MSQPVRLGIVGTGRIAEKFVEDMRWVPQMEVAAVFNPRFESAERFAARWSNAEKRPVATDSFAGLLGLVDAIYVASPSETHFSYAERALDASVHVLCEKPLAFRRDMVKRLYELAEYRGVVFLHAVKTAFFPGFQLLEETVASGVIGEVVDVEASFTKLMTGNIPELAADGTGGSMRWLSTYPLYAISRLVGTDLMDARFYSRWDAAGVEVFTKACLRFPDASASLKVGFGAKTDGTLVVSGTKGYLLVPAPWWNTAGFEVHFEDPHDVRFYGSPFAGNGLSYEAATFAEMIVSDKIKSDRISEADDLFFAEVYELFYGKSQRDA